MLNGEKNLHSSDTESKSILKTNNSFVYKAFESHKPRGSVDMNSTVKKVEWHTERNLLENQIKSTDNLG